MMNQITLRNLAAAAVITAVAFLGSAMLAQAGLPISGGVAAETAPADGAEGIPLGGFRAYPRLDVGLAYSDNIYAADDSVGTTSDTRINIGPAVSIQSGWSRHSLTIGGYAGTQVYMDETGEDRTDWGIGASGQLDVQESTDLTGGLNFQHLVEDRGGINSPTNISEPSEYDQLDLNFALNHRFDQLNASIGADYRDREYDLAGQQYRDGTEWRGMGELGFEFSPGYSAFGRVVINNRDFDNVQAGSGLSQDSDGYNFSVGVSSEITNLISGEAYLGYLEQDYDNFATVDGFTFGAELSWAVSDLTTVRASAYRSVDDSATPGVGGILTTGGGIGVDHELSRSLNLTGDLRIASGDYQANVREDDTLTATIGLDYEMTRKLHLSLAYEYDDRDSNTAANDYTENLVTFGIRFQN